MTKICFCDSHKLGKMQIYVTINIGQLAVQFIGCVSWCVRNFNIISLDTVNVVSQNLLDNAAG